MNRTDRLLAIVLELQRHGRRRAADLAATFETSKRTIYRDIEALCEARVPIVSIQGRGYSLMPGYFLPPLSFTTEEATMLLLGSDFMAQNFDAQYREAAIAARRKIEGVLPEQLRAGVNYLQENINFIVRDANSNQDLHTMLQQLRRAVIERCSVRFIYHTRQETTLRDADPYSLFYIAGAWYLVAYCHVRQDMRNFRLDRIDNLTLLTQSFERPANLQAQIRERHRDRSGMIVVRVLFKHEIARWVRETRSFFYVAEEETADGLLVTYNVRQENDIFPWLLGWGRNARILEPASLRERLCEEASAILANQSISSTPSHY